jgi:nucleoside-diphosphate-sugar epimerase
VSAYAGARALVLGAGGFVGRWVAGALAREGAELALAVRDTRAARRVLAAHDVGGDLREVDLARTGEAAELVRATRPSIVFDLAGYGVDREEQDERLAQRLNTDLVAEIAEAFEPDPGWRGQAIVHAGSALEFGTVATDLAEPWHCEPTTDYGRTKLAGARALAETSRRRGFRALTARLFTVYGAGEHAGRLLPTLIEASRHSNEIPLTAGAQRRDFTYVGDVAEGLLRLGLVERDFEPRALNLATGRLTSVREFVEIAARALGIADRRLRFGALPTRPEEMSHEPASIAALRELVGWSPATSIDAGVRAALAFERRAGR